MTLVEVRIATLADVDSVLELWSTAAENASRPPDTAAALAALLERDPSRS